jgi:hypothetical protein
MQQEVVNLPEVLRWHAPLQRFDCAPSAHTSTNRTLAEAAM